MNILLTLFTAFTAAIPCSNFTETPVNTYEGNNIIPITEECNLVNCEDEIILYNNQNIYNLGTIQIDGCIDSVNEIFMFCNEEHGTRLYSFNKFNQNIAETYLENYKLVNNVRGMFAYTGTYKGKEVSVMGSGMGMPSIGIYSYELFKFDL